MQFNRLFSPLQLGALELRNRIVMPAFNHACCKEGRITEQLTSFYVKVAEGGAGLIVFGGMAVSPEGKGTAMPCLFDDSFCRGITAFTSRVASAGPGKLFAQLFHAGRYARPAIIGEDPVGPSAIYCPYSKSVPRAPEEEELPRIVEDHILAATRAKICGFHGVEILASAGYLHASFISPVTNRRTDSYGGSVSSRSRLLTECISGIKKRLGDDFPVAVRLSGREFMEGGTDVTHASEVAGIIEKSGADALNITGGWHESPVPQITYHLPPGGFSYLAAAVREGVSIPVIVSNRIMSPKIAEELLAQGAGDAVSMGRALICDPDLPLKAQQKRTLDIRPCVACGQGCTDSVFAGRQLRCALNIEVGRVRLPTSAPGGATLVVGGGIAGIKAALFAARQGGSVKLWEKGAHLGGKLFYAANQRPEIAMWLTYAENALRKAGVSITFKHHATAKEVEASTFDRLILATGAVPKKLPFDVSHFAGQIITAQEIWQETAFPGKNVVIIGGGALGAETAAVLAARSALSQETARFLLMYNAENPTFVQRMLTQSRRRIFIVEKKGKIGLGLGMGTRWVTMKNLSLYGVSLHADSEAVAARQGDVVITIAGVKTHIPCDTIINATGFVPCNSLHRELEARGIPFRSIGDAEAPSGFQIAIQQAFDCIYRDY